MENDVLMYIDDKLQVFRNRYWDDIGTNFKSVVRQSLSDMSRAEGSLSGKCNPGPEAEASFQSTEGTWSGAGLAGKGPQRFGSVLHLWNFWYDI